MSPFALTLTNNLKKKKSDSQFSNIHILKPKLLEDLDIYSLAF